MFKNSKDPKKAEQITSIIAIIVILGVILFFLKGYIFNTEDVSLEADLNLIDQRDAERAAIGQELFEVLGRITELKLEPTVLQHPAFDSLQDFETQITPRNVGKANPFTPLPLEVQANVLQQTTPRR